MKGPLPAVKERAFTTMRRYLPLSLTIISALLVLSGIALGEHEEVFKKAVNLCLSCIGLG